MFLHRRKTEERQILKDIVKLENRLMIDAGPADITGRRGRAGAQHCCESEVPC